MEYILFRFAVYLPHGCGVTQIVDGLELEAQKLAALEQTVELSDEDSLFKTALQLRAENIRADIAFLLSLVS